MACINVPFVYMVHDVNDLDAVNIHFKDYWKGWALKIETFWGPEMSTSEACAKKVEVSGVLLPPTHLHIIAPGEIYVMCIEKICKNPQTKENAIQRQTEFIRHLLC
jgi:hypothetical protein